MNAPQNQPPILATFETGESTSEVIQLCPVPPGWYAIHGFGADAIKKPVAALALVRWRWGKGAPSFVFHAVVGWGDTGFELADGDGWQGVVGPGENVDALPSAPTGEKAGEPDPLIYPVAGWPGSRMAGGGSEP